MIDVSSQIEVSDGKNFLSKYFDLKFQIINVENGIVNTEFVSFQTGFITKKRIINK